MNTLDYILKKFQIAYRGCFCNHLPSEHEHGVLKCQKCPCPRYTRNLPVDIPNFGRNDLPQLFRELGFRRGAEIGVKRGEYSEVLCRNFPELKLFCVDAWTAYHGYRLNHQEGMDLYFKEASKRLAPFNCTLMRKFSVEAAKTFEDGSLDFVYIDGAHDFLNVTQDLCAWVPKVRAGGIVSGHDYRLAGMGPTTFGKANVSYHVKEVIDAYTLAFHIDPFFAIGRKEYIAGEVRDKIRSFMWVKE